MSDPVTRLNAALEGRYAIERELGEGGMATVYLADDLKHNRKVALKVLKPDLAAVVGAERFLAEITTTANLTHPHILPLHDSGEADSFLFYVMPYVEGETLRDRIDRQKQLPVNEAVALATKVAGALHHAHEHGVIHRDIKPANILLQDGEPVVSDFGIALALGVAGGTRLTETGLSVGTPFYMSPEQATGDQAVGASTDTYALGSVLYEMLVGEPPYPGTTAQAVLGRIIAGKPVSATEQRPSIPANVDAAVRKALEKLPADRFASAQEFSRALSDEHFRYGELATRGSSEVVGPWKRIAIGAIAVAAVTTAGFGWSLLRPEPPAPLARFSSPFEEGQGPTGAVRFTPDGSALVYAGPAESGPGPQLWIRRWDELDATPIRGTEGAVSFALSPDGREVAFSAFPGPLRVVALDGGSARTLVNEVFIVGDWAPDGTVHFNTSPIPSVLGRVPGTGGSSDAVEILSELQGSESIHAFLRVLPGGRMGVFQVWHATTGEDAEIWAIDLDTQERRLLTPGHTPQYASSGHLLFGTPDGVLMAAPIDPGTAEFTGSSIPVAEGLALNAFGVSLYSVSASGDLLYVTGAGGVVTRRSLVWVDRDGREEPIEAPLNLYVYPRISPDGRRVALDTRGADGGIWIWNFDGETLMRLILGDGGYEYPVWTPNGERVAYGAVGSRDVYWKASNNTGVTEMLAEAPGSEGLGALSPYFFTPDGAALVFRDQQTPETNDDLMMISVEDDTPDVWRLTGDYRERNAELSPDGRWMAYQSDESGTFEIYVRPFPQVEEDQVLVSNNGGVFPLWSRDGSELFYLQRGAGVQLMSVSVDIDETDRSFPFRDREVVMEWPYFAGLEGRSYDVSQDGQRFLAIKAGAGAEEGGASARAILVQNWFEELRERVPN